MLPVNNGFVADASGKIAMSCGTLASSLSKVRVVALLAGSVIVVLSNASPDAVTVVVVPPGAGAPDDGGGAADVGGGPPLARGPPGGGPPPPPAGGAPRGGRPPAPAAARRHGHRPGHIGVDVAPEEVRAGLQRGDRVVALRDAGDDLASEQVVLGGVVRIDRQVVRHAVVVVVEHERRRLAGLERQAVGVEREARRRDRRRDAAPALGAPAG